MKRSNKKATYVPLLKRVKKSFSSLINTWWNQNDNMLICPCGFHFQKLLEAVSISMEINVMFYHDDDNSLFWVKGIIRDLKTNKYYFGKNSDKSYAVVDIDFNDEIKRDFKLYADYYKKRIEGGWRFV